MKHKKCEKRHDYLLQTSTVSDEDILLWSSQSHILMVDKTYTIGNLTVSSTHIDSNSTNQRRKIDVFLAKGMVSNIPLMCKIATTPKNKCSWIWKNTVILNNKKKLQEKKF